MGLYYFRCTKCSSEYRRLLEPEELDKLPTGWCSKCGHVLERAPRGASTSVKETVDNGWQARKIERPANVVDLVADRNLKHDMEYEEPEPDELDLAPLNTDGEKI